MPGYDRRKPEDVTPPSRIEVLEKAVPKKRSRRWERKQASRTATYRLTEDIKQRMKEIARQEEATVSDVARCLLEFAIAAYERGDLMFERVAVERYTLEVRENG